LTTTQGPLRLRLVDEKTGAFLNGVRVRVGRSGFDSGTWERTTGLDGLIVTPDAYANLAFVTVYRGGVPPAQVPVEIVDDRVVVCRVDVSAAAQAAGQVQLRRDRWIRRTLEGLRVVATRFTDLNAALARSPEAALELAQEIRKGITGEIDNLTAERDQLRRNTARPDLSQGELLLSQFQDERGKLDNFITRQEALIKHANDPETKALQTKIERAHLRETEADFAGAIALYEEVLRRELNQPKIKAHLDRLKADWQTKGPDHVRAREFVYNTWPRLEPSALKGQIDDAVKAFAACRAHGDHLTPRKLRQVNLLHAANLAKRIDVLRLAADSEDNRAETKALLAVADRLRRLQADVTAFLTPAKKAAKGQAPSQ
jgi:hypothetical protein